MKRVCKKEDEKTKSSSEMIVIIFFSRKKKWLTYLVIFSGRYSLVYCPSSPLATSDNFIGELLIMKALCVLYPTCCWHKFEGLDNCFRDERIADFIGQDCGSFVNTAHSKTLSELWSIYFLSFHVQVNNNIYYNHF